MNVLFLAPHPFYQERGTPIAVNLMLRVLSERNEKVDVITYHEGRDVRHDGMTVYRIPHLPFIHDVRPGFSFKKLLCDGVMAMQAFLQLLRKRYHVVHAVEEAVFIALLLKMIFRVPYVYDMDSSLAQQMVEKHSALGPFLSVFTYLESVAIKYAKAVVPVCDALGDVASRHGAKKVCVLHDVPLFEESSPSELTTVEPEIASGRGIMMYVGNLEVYQGIDLLLDSFALITAQDARMDLVIVGGARTDIEKYQQKSRELNIEERVSFLGPKPLDQLASFLDKADILVSPRGKGNNTPMKLYSYLHSGKPIVATNLPTHTQVLNEQVAMLAEPNPKSFSQGMLCLMKDQAFARKIGRAGKQLVQEKFSYGAFCEKVNELYGWIATDLECPERKSVYRCSPYSSNHTKRPNSESGVE